LHIKLSCKPAVIVKIVRKADWLLNHEMRIVA
jgi:hypothetical protein